MAYDVQLSKHDQHHGHHHNNITTFMILSESCRDVEMITLDDTEISELNN